MKVKFNNLAHSVYDLDRISIVNHFSGTGTAYYLQIRDNATNKNFYLNYDNENKDKCLSDVEKIWDMQNESEDIIKL